jgi:hypothetical protein
LAASVRPLKAAKALPLSEGRARSLLPAHARFALHSIERVANRFDQACTVDWLGKTRYGAELGCARNRVRGVVGAQDDDGDAESAARELGLHVETAESRHVQVEYYAGRLAAHE